MNTCAATAICPGGTAENQTSQKLKNQDRDCKRFNSPTSLFPPLPPVQKTEGNGANGEGKERNSVSTSGLNQHRPLVSSENSPVFQDWVSGVGTSSPGGTAERGCCSQMSQPSLRDSFSGLSQPSAETLGYCPLSLRDNDNTFSLDITAPQKPVQQSLAPYLSAIRDGVVRVSRSECSFWGIGWRGLGSPSVLTRSLGRRLE
jgi:hypothetical protein